MEFNTPWLDFPQLLKAAQGKKIIFWGCDTFFEKTAKVHRFNISHLVDSAKNQQGVKVHHSYDVLDPQTLKTLENKNEYYIIITSSAFYEIINILKSYGYSPGADFSFTPLLRNFKILDEILTHEQTLIFSSSDADKDSDSEGGGIYEFSIPSGKLEKKVWGITRGFAKYKDNYFVVDALKGIRALDADYNDLENIQLPQHSVPHGLEIDYENNLIYVVLSQRDEIQAYDIKTFKLVRSIILSDKFRKTGIYHHHMNDICLNGSSLYISMFSKSGNVQKEFYDSAIVEYDLEADEKVGPIVDNLWQPHSVRIIHNNICYLDSMRGDFHIYPQKAEAHFNGFVRGLDYDGKYYYIGQSIHRYFDRMIGYSNNISIDSGIFLFDNISKGCKFYSTPAIKDINTIKLAKPFLNEI